jgi:hypothetical protein
MVSYGLTGEEESDSNFDTPPERPQTRKRTHPNAFPEEERSGSGIYPYSNNNAIPIAIEESQEWMLSLGLTPSSFMDCFKTAFSLVLDATVEYGGRFFIAGIVMVRNISDYSWFMDGEEQNISWGCGTTCVKKTTCFT